MDTQQTPQNKLLIPIAIVLAGAFVAAAIYFGDGQATAGSVASGYLATSNTKVEVPPVTEKDHIIGSRSAPIVVVEYSDTECPFCKVFHNTMKQIVSTYSGQVAWVYRHFPIAQLHAKAIHEAEATECAAELGGNEAFWNFTNKVFETTNSNDSLDPAELPKIAKSIGLSETDFTICLNSGKYRDQISASIQEAVKAGARGTPYSIIISKGGKKEVINGAEPLESVRAKINALLR